MKQWNGDEQCPVNADKMVEIEYRNGMTEKGFAGDFRWSWFQDSYDIVAYKTAKEKRVE